MLGWPQFVFSPETVKLRDPVDADRQIETSMEGCAECAHQRGPWVGSIRNGRKKKTGSEALERVSAAGSPRP